MRHRGFDDLDSDRIGHERNGVRRRKRSKLSQEEIDEALDEASQTQRWN